ncbi:MAG TPA: glycosyltransferase family 4 protein [Gemmatimonadales bacterium]|nr:glycosyltransferase family 4 protein [Gemmatimonadales bacterium]
MRILQLMSCRGWSSDAYWAAGISGELERAGHDVTLVCRRGSESRVMRRARESGISRIETLGFAGGVKPGTDVIDLRRLIGWLGAADVVHVHRGKEHWLAAVANRLARTPRPLVRTRHIVQPVRPHVLNRWLYREATSLVVTVTEAIRRQYIAAELVPPERAVALPGGVDLLRFHPTLDGGAARRALGAAPDIPLIGLVSGLRIMKGHEAAIEAARRLAGAGRRFHLLFVGGGALDARIRQAVVTAGLSRHITVMGFVPDLPAAMAALDVALDPAIESDGMSRVVFEYLATGKPVIASRVGVVPEVLEDGKTAFLVPAGDAAALAQAIARLLDDPGLARKLGASGAELARSRLSGAHVAQELVRRYSRLIGHERPAA